MKKAYLLFITTLFLIMPVYVKAESKIYFQNDQMSIQPGNTYKANIKVDSDEPFSEVDFNIITLSEKVNFSKVIINSNFTNSSNTSFSLTSKTLHKSGTTIATVTFKVDNKASVGESYTLKIVDAKVEKQTVDNNSLSLTVKEKDSNELASLTSKIAPIDFNKKTTTYTVEVDKDIDEFDLVATPVDKDAKVYISSQKLNLRKNTIIIRVTREGLKTKTYKVIVNKNINNDNYKQIQKESKQDQITNVAIKSKWLIVISFIGIMIIIDMFFIRKNK